MKILNLYSKMKLVIYLIGFILCLFFYIKHGLVSSHTPPTTFVISVLFGILSMIWLIIDWIITLLRKDLDIEFKTNYVGFIGNLLILILVTS